MGTKGTWHRPDPEGNYRTKYERISPRCTACRGRGTVTQKAADPAQPPIDVDCPKCKKEDVECQN